MMVYNLGKVREGFKFNMIFLLMTAQNLGNGTVIVRNKSLIDILSFSYLGDVLGQKFIF